MQTLETTPFGRGLRHWRRIRGISQLELASTAATTTRHLSYLETGRSRPSQQMVQRLGDALAIPLRERNRLLEMAGLAPVYPEGDLTTSDLAPFQQVIDRLLASHDPFPGLLVDRHWNLIQGNRTATAFFGDDQHPNLVDLALERWRPLIENWTEIVSALHDRLANDLLRFPDDEVLQELHARVRATLGPRPPAHAPSTARVICPRFLIDGQLIRTVTVAARFESAADITLDEVRVELIYPEDAPSERYFRTLTEPSSTT